MIVRVVVEVVRGSSSNSGSGRSSRCLLESSHLMRIASLPPGTCHHQASLTNFHDKRPCCMLLSHLMMITSFKYLSLSDTSIKSRVKVSSDVANDILLMGDLHIYDILRPREKKIYDKPYPDLRASTELRIPKTHCECEWLFNHMPACLYLCFKSQMIINCFRLSE